MSRAGRPIVALVEHGLALAGWENFYVIVGSSAAALTGLQFVVITLIGTEPRLKGSGAEVGVFGTPTVLHFCSVLIVACVLSSPWRDVSNAATALGIYGGFGVFYCGIITRRATRRMNYTPVAEDWIWHTVLPFLVYATVLISALVLPRHRSALFAVAAAALLLLLIGIRNAWDSVTYIALERRKEQ
jgi:hypothetical protein